jgi:hypothetical protein
MSTASMNPPGAGGAAGTSGRPDWLFGPAWDLTLGCGGAYLVLFALTYTGVVSLGRDVDLVIGPYLVLIFSVPHYGATLLRVYEHREDRHRYRIFAVWAALLIYGAFFVGLNVAWFGAGMLSIYLTWSPWHYAGQNFGVCMTFLRRSGSEIDPLARKLLQASFSFSYGIVALSLHGSDGRQLDYPTEARYFGGIEFQSLGLPEIFTSIGMPLCMIGVLLCAGGSVWLMRRQISLRQWVAPLMVLSLQTIWFTLPLSVAHFQLTTGTRFIDIGARDVQFTFIAITHAAQYLWITTYFARKSSGWKGYGNYWLKALAFGHAAVLIPTLLAAKTPLAGVSFDAGTAALSVAALNLHHFTLDGAIWKLRSGKIADILLRGKPGDAPNSLGTPPAWRRPALTVLTGALCVVAVSTVVVAVNGVDLNIREGRTDEAERALDVLNWVGRDSGRDRLALATALAEQGRDEDARPQFERSAALRPHPQPWLQLAELHERQGRLPEALAAYDRALELQPRWLPAIKGAGLAAHRAGMHEEAVERLRVVVSTSEADEETMAVYTASRRAILAKESAGGASTDR